MKHGAVKVIKTPCKNCGRLFPTKANAKSHPDFCAPLKKKAASWKR